MMPEPVDPERGLSPRFALGVAVALLTVVLVVAARSEPSSAEDRIGRRVELIELIAAEQARVKALEDEVATLSAQVAEFEATSAAGAEQIARLQAKVDEIAVPAGLTALRGPGVVVTLRDSTRAYSGSVDPNDLVIHEQDLQAVINALWAGGGEAMSVNGQRVLATTAIRCVGNTLLLHGGLYSPPYEIAVIGDAVALRAALDRDPAVARFAAAAEQFELGFDVVEVEDLTVPASAGPPALQVAQPEDAVAS